MRRTHFDLWTVAPKSAACSGAECDRTTTHHVDMTQELPLLVRPGAVPVCNVKSLRTHARARTYTTMQRGRIGPHTGEDRPVICT